MIELLDLSMMSAKHLRHVCGMKCNIGVFGSLLLNSSSELFRYNLTLASKKHNNSLEGLLILRSDTT
jgi:hypothetical protein